MKKLKVFRLLFSFAALMFIAKPFVGFSTNSSKVTAFKTHTILAKSFTKRKPEGIEEAEINLKAVHQLLTNPYLFLLSPITLLLLFLFGPLSKLFDKLDQRLLFEYGYSISSFQHTFLFTGKLII